MQLAKIIPRTMRFKKLCDKTATKMSSASKRRRENTDTFESHRYANAYTHTYTRRERKREREEHRDRKTNTKITDLDDTYKCIPCVQHFTA